MLEQGLPHDDSHGRWADVVEAAVHSHGSLDGMWRAGAGDVEFGSGDGAGFDGICQGPGHARQESCRG